MIFVTDPDNLDRFEVAVDPLGEKISVRGLGTVRVDIANTGNTDGTASFSDTTGSANFTASGVAVNDILSIISADTGNIIGHYTVSGTIVGTSFDVIGNIPAPSVGDQLTYKIAEPDTINQVGETAADGVSMQTLYSFLKEEWRNLSPGLGNAEDLIQFTFPIESITSEQFEIGGTTHADFDFFDSTTQNLIRTGGWQKLDSAGNVIQDYAGIITLGSLDSFLGRSIS